MHLRSGRLTDSAIGPRAPSRVPTQGSGTQSVGNLVDIAETFSESQSETLSRTTSSLSMDNVGPSNSHPLTPNRTPTRSFNPFEADTMGLPLNVRLQYVYTNAQGAEIFRDPQQRYLVKIADIFSELDRAPLVNDQGNMYMGGDGVRYEVTYHPENVDKLGELSKTKFLDLSKLSRARESRDDWFIEPDMPGPSNAPSSKPSIDDLLLVDLNLERDRKGKSKMDQGAENQWEFVRQIPVTKVLQDDPLQEVYKDSLEGYYATTRLPELDLPLALVVVVEKLAGHMNRIVDKWANDY